MRSLLCLAAIAAIALSSSLSAGIDGDVLIEKRGDANLDNVVNLSDAHMLLEYLYEGGEEPPCMNHADVNSDGAVTPVDPHYLLNWLFNGGSPPPDPGPFSPYCTVVDESLKISCNDLSQCFPSSGS